MSGKSVVERAIHSEPNHSSGHCLSYENERVRDENRKNTKTMCSKKKKTNLRFYKSVVNGKISVRYGLRDRNGQKDLIQRCNAAAADGAGRCVLYKAFDGTAEKT